MFTELFEVSLKKKLRTFELILPSLQFRFRKFVVMKKLGNRRE